MAALAIVLAACGGKDSAQTATATGEIPAVAGAADRATLTGAGSTFVEPLLRQWIERYRTLAPGVAIEYQGSGSEVAVERLASGQGDFFTSDVPLTELEEVALGGSDAVAQLPWAAGAIAVAYNLPDVAGLRLSPPTLAAVFAGRVQRWDDPAIRADNPQVRLPDLPIQVIYRSDGSGTTEVFSAYLEATAGGSWGLGTDKRLRFPRGTPAIGSDALAAAVKRTTGAVGYVQLSHARRASLDVALLGNQAGEFVAPTPEAVNAALTGATLRPYGTTAGLLFTPESPGAYPLSTFSYLLYSRRGTDPDKARALRNFAAWALSEGQRMAEPLGYTLVPRQFRVQALAFVQRP